MLLGSLLVHGLHHNTHDRLGAARTQQDATVLTERRFCGGHGTQMDGYSQAYLSGAEQARNTLLDMKEGK